MRQSNLLAYTAGIIDGEGCISICKRKRPHTRGGYGYELVVVVGNTNEWLIQWLKMQYGGWITHRGNGPNRKMLWDWYISAHKALEFLELILPYLQMKRPQAELAIKFQSAKVKPPSRWSKTEADWAVEEAQRIMMNQYNRRGAHPD